VTVVSDQTAKFIAAGVAANPRPKDVGYYFSKTIEARDINAAQTRVKAAL
jgi:hypothetical protein